MLCFQAHAQEGKKFKKPLKIKAPAEQPTEQPAPPQEPEPEPPQEEEESEMDEGPAFAPVKAPSMVSEDTTTLDEGELSVVEVTEEVKVDSVWVKIAEYYAIWDSRYVNPYKIDPTKFSDTVVIHLYDEAKGQMWAAPLATTHVTSNFGFRGYRWHYGTDLELDTGDTVRAAFDGMVRIVRYDQRGWGKYVVVRHYNGLETLYGHLSRQDVETGQLVKAGDVLGLGGSTGRSSGPHLHMEIRYQGNAINPTTIYDFTSNTLVQPVFTLTPQHFAYYGSAKTAVVRKTMYHTVRSGDNLGKIARRYGVSVSYLCKINRITTKTILRTGRRLRVK
ncbi:M23 family metallopeptidase [Rhodocytophaga aerolata]|uniref:M23 family metallopeptidase n=1 Tax=Rhodocytophaga aerolata TaxID=455078 RepID=A0ABT8R856_9BACT|nr:M23 family metallopeptidase [Rhodocytophaga aerolata]MDO1446937.1 M23 family metallopeptidase [Rhodocytophaga aerolata]